MSCLGLAAPTDAGILRHGDHTLSRDHLALTVPVEYASDRKIRERNKLYYRFNHWPIWIFVFFIAPGPLTFDLFERGFDARMALWLGAVLVGTGIAGLRGALPGVEPRPYIIRFTEDRPNPLYRRVCYTFAWSEVITFAVLNIAGLLVAIVTGQWYLKQITGRISRSLDRSGCWRVAYFPLAGSIWLLGAFGHLPRVKASTKGEGHERRYFYGSVWAVCWAQPTLWLLWRVMPRTRLSDTLKLARVRRHPGFRRQSGPPRPSSSHASHRSGRARRLGLIRCFSRCQVVRRHAARRSMSTRSDADALDEPHDVPGHNLPVAEQGWKGWDEYAPFYDWENAQTLGRRDVAFWRRVAKGAKGRVLELGCGTGRISLPLARAGIPIVGIDRSEPMLGARRVGGRFSANERARLGLLRWG